MKRFLALALCLMMACPALAETFAVNYYGGQEADGYAMLLKDDGTPLTPADTYAHIYALTPNSAPEAERLYYAEPIALNVDIGDADPYDLPYESFYRVALMDAQGKLLTGFDYWNLQWTGGYIICSAPGEIYACCGALDAAGHVVIEPKYADLEYLGNGRWLALASASKSKDGETETYAALLLDADGSETPLDLHTTSAYLYTDTGGLCPLEDVVEFGGQSVYIDPDGQICFGRSFDSVNAFQGDFAVVKVDGKTGLIDRTGAFVAEAIHDYISYEGEAPDDLFIAQDDAKLTVYSAQTGEKLMTRDFAPAEYASASCFAPGLIWVYTDGPDYCVSLDGALFKTFENDEDTYVTYVRSSAEAPRLMESRGRWPRDMYRFTDLDGNPVGGEYNGLGESLWKDGHSRHNASVYQIKKDEDGDEVVDWRTWRVGVVDENGEVVLAPVYTSYIELLSLDRFWVSTEGRTGMVDDSGNWLYAIDDYANLMD